MLEESPPITSEMEGSVPVLEFSHTMGLTLALAQGSDAALTAVKPAVSQHDTAKISADTNRIVLARIIVFTLRSPLPATQPQVFT